MKRSFLLITIFCLIFTSCNSKQETKEESKTGAQLTEISDTGLSEVYISDKLSLKLNFDTLNLLVENKVTGQVFSSSPTDIDSDTVASDDYKTVMKSQLVITHVFGRNVRTMNSFTDCVANKQYKVFKLSNGVRIEYTLGDISLTSEDIPEKLSKKRAEQLILKNDALSDELKEVFTFSYVKEKNGVYTKKTNLFGSKQKEVLKVFEAIDYSQEDLRKDCAEFGVKFAPSKKVGFVIPVEYTVEDNSFNASVIMKDIKCPKDSPILTINLLPYFGAQKTSEDGYLFMPDGSGIILPFQNKNDISMTLGVFSADISTGKPSPQPLSQPVLMPVFGMKNGSNAFLGIIESGDAFSVINSLGARKNSSYNAVSPTFTVCASDNMDLSAVTTVPTEVGVYQSNISDQPLSVKYKILDGDNADYSGMARAYRDYLFSDKKARKEISAKLPFYLEAIGAIETNKSFFGINYTGVTVLSTYDNIREMADTFKNEGADVYLRLSGWFNSGINQTIPTKINRIGALGSKSKLDALTVNYNTYLDVSFLRLSSNKGLSPTKYAAKKLDQQYVKTYLSELTKGYLLTPLKLNSLMNNFLNRTKTISELRLSLRDLGNAAYADYNKTNETDRQQGLLLAVDSVKKASENVKGLMLDSANMKTALFAQHIVNVPIGGSKYLAGGKDVPFYQIVLHGFLSYSGTPLNLSSSPEEDILKAAEYGAGLSFKLSYTDMTKVDGLFADELYSVYFEDFANFAAEKYKKLAEVLDGLNDLLIISHKYITDALTVTTYEDGTMVVVNYGSTDAEYEGHTVKAKGFIKIEVEDK